MKLIIGLGNPEGKYSDTRHNLGFDVVDEFAKQIGGGVWSVDNKFKAEILETNYNLQPSTYNLLLVKPQTYMNHSGMAVSLIANYYKIAPEDIIVVYDELDLHLGKIKVRLGGAAAGHHGVESIISELNTDKFVRVRLGIGNSRTRSGEHKGQTISAEKFVLESFMPNEKSQVKHMIKQAIKALDTLLKKGLEYAQNQFN